MNVKKISLLLCVFVSTALFVIGCNSNKITLEDFEKVGKVYGDSDSDAAIESSSIGKTTEMAMVPIIVDENNVMYNRDSPIVREVLNGRSNKKITTYFTDLQTFAKVTQDPFATVDYVECIGTNEENMVCLHDSYKRNPVSDKSYQEMRDNKLLNNTKP